MWFNGGSSLNFKVHFFKWACFCTLNMLTNKRRYFAQLYVSSSNVSVMNAAADSVSKQDVQNVNRLQQHTIEIYCEMIRLSYQ